MSYWTDGERHVGEQTFGTQDEALGLLSDIETSIRREFWIDPRSGQTTLTEYADEWLARRHLQPRTVELYRGLVDRHVLPQLVSRELATILPSMVTAGNTKLRSTYAITAAKPYRLLSTIMRDAVINREIAFLPCTVRNGGAEHSPERPTASIAEVEALNQAIPERLLIVVLLGTWCQLRRGELLGLRRRDIDLLRGHRRVEQTLQNLKDSSVVVGPSKSEAGRRTLTIPRHVLSALEDHLDRFEDPRPEALVLTGEKGGPLSPQHLYVAWNKARIAGVRPDLHLHDLRHTGLFWSAATAASLVEIMRRGGQSSAAAALRYEHATDDRDKVLADSLSQLAERAEMVATRREEGASADAARTH